MTLVSALQGFRRSSSRRSSSVICRDLSGTPMGVVTADFTGFGAQDSCAVFSTTAETYSLMYILSISMRFSDRDEDGQ